LGHTIYYTTSIKRWDEFVAFIKRICRGLGWDLEAGEESIAVFPPCIPVEPLVVKRRGEGFAKTNLSEPCHSIYLLILHSVSSFGAVSIWED